MKSNSEIAQQPTMCQSSATYFNKQPQNNLAQSLNQPYKKISITTSLPLTPNNGDYADHIIDIKIPKVITRRMTKNDYATNANGLTVPIEIFCNNCQRVNFTRIEMEYGIGAMMVTCLLLVLFLPLFWLPCVLSTCKDFIHYCPFCNQIVGQTSYTLC